MMYYLITAPDRSDLFWRPQSNGYTTQIAEAGIYSKQEAERIVRLKRGDNMHKLYDFRNEIDKLIEQCDKHKENLTEMKKMIEEE